MRPLQFPQCLQSGRHADAGTTIANMVLMALRLPFSKEAVAIAVMSAGLAICTAWHFERSGPDYEFLQQLEVLRQTRPIRTPAEPPPLRARNGYAQR